MAAIAIQLDDSGISPMRTFLIGAIVALILTGATAYLYQLAGVTAAERSSPSRSVRIGETTSTLQSEN